MRVGLATSQQMRTGSDPALSRLMKAFAPYWREYQIEIHVTGGTFRDIVQNNWLDGCLLQSLPDGANGGFMVMASKVATKQLDQVIYLLDPYDLRTLHAETAALKRQCVVHQVPFLSTMTGAIEWLLLEWFSRNPLNLSEELQSLFRLNSGHFDLKQQSIALIAHDAYKEKMLDFADGNRALLDQFAMRYATGTTGGLIMKRLGDVIGAVTPQKPSWINALLSGPLGGDAQIAELVIMHQCRRVIFFEDPHVARQHEADIQLLERATRLPGIECLCLNDFKSAALWADRLALYLQTHAHFC